MNAPLPDYDPPSAQRAAVAAGLAPLLVLLAFTLIVTGLMQVDTGLAVFAACTVWVVYELHQYQGQIDTYNQRYVHAHLAWRSPAMLHSLSDVAHPPTREFVHRFIAAEGILLRDGQLP